MLMVFGDTHIPFEDKAAVEATLKFLKDYKNDIEGVVLIGDIVDCYSVSRYDKDPRRLLTLQDELNQGKAFLKRLRKIYPDGPIWYVEGNHEERLYKYAIRKAPALATLDVVTISHLLGLKDLNIKYIPRTKDLRFGKLYFTHGDQVQAHSKYFASKLFEKFGVSVIAGHCHRPDSYFKRDRRGIGGAWGIACLCDLEPEYIIGIANWCHGFALVHNIDGKWQRFHVEHVFIFNGKVTY